MPKNNPTKRKQIKLNWKRSAQFLVICMVPCLCILSLA